MIFIFGINVGIKAFGVKDLFKFICFI